MARLHRLRRGLRAHLSVTPRATCRGQRSRGLLAGSRAERGMGARYPRHPLPCTRWHHLAGGVRKGSTVPGTIGSGTGERADGTPVPPGEFLHACTGHQYPIRVFRAEAEYCVGSREPKGSAPPRRGPGSIEPCKPLDREAPRRSSAAAPRRLATDRHDIGSRRTRILM